MYIKVNGTDIEAFYGKDVILFGCGSCGLRALEEFEKAGANILGFCDNNPRLAGTQISSYEIMAPGRLKDFPGVDIIITSTYEKEIAKQLEEMGHRSFYTIKLGVLKETIPREQFQNRLLSEEEANQYIYDGIKGTDPFFIGRLGSVELECLSHYLYFLDRKKSKDKPYPSNVKMMMNINAGFFPSEDELLDCFSELYINTIKDMDILWSMWFSKFEDMIYREYVNNKVVASYDETALPIALQNPWTRALEGKKVLVIHPFEQSILDNYRIKDKLFTTPGFLPDFKLITLKAVQSIAGNETQFIDWFAALESMKQQMAQIDFDIALIGAGAYGMPLGAYAKRLGKKAVHVGGYLQLYFGIKGRAWDKLGIYNEYWTSPKKSEFPEGYQKVEAGRYW